MKRRMRVAMVSIGLLAAGAGAGAGAGCGSSSAKKGGARAATISMSEVPAAVSAAFARDYPGVRVTRVARETYADGLVHYELAWTDAHGTKREVEYSADGERLEAH